MTELGEFFARYPRCALAFSGGTDSALLLYEARRLGADVRAYFVRGPFQPRFELEDARRLAAELGAELSVLELDVLSLPEVAKNGPDRCYHCKRAIFSAIARRAAADGYGVVIDGTNASDRSDDRPGMRAMGELGVLSPLRICGISKRRVRELSREAGLFTAEKPSYACLGHAHTNWGGDNPWGTGARGARRGRAEGVGLLRLEGEAGGRLRTAGAAGGAAGAGRRAAGRDTPPR